MNIVLWVVQILLALAFLMAGAMKSTQPIDKLAVRMKWVNAMKPPQLVRLIGILEADSLQMNVANRKSSPRGRFSIGNIHL